MSTMLKEVLREMIKNGNLETAEDLHSYLKDLFKDALQEMLEAELEDELGYEKGDRKNKITDKILPHITEWKNRPLRWYLPSACFFW